MASKTRQPSNKIKRPEETPRQTMTARVMSWSRSARTAIAVWGALVLAFALQQLTGEMYTRIFSTTMALSTLSWIIATACVGMYFAGYVYIIGIPGTRPEAGRAQTIYLLTLAVLTIVSVAWLIIRAAGVILE